MEHLNELSFEAIKRYFIALSQFGSKSYSEVYKLLVLLFIKDIIEGELGLFISEDEFRTITKALYCLTGTTCLISYPDVKTPDLILNKYYKNPSLRMSEIELVRLAEDDMFRVPSN